MELSAEYVLFCMKDLYHSVKSDILTQQDLEQKVNHIDSIYKNWITFNKVNTTICGVNF